MGFLLFWAFFTGNIESNAQILSNTKLMVSFVCHNEEDTIYFTQPATYLDERKVLVELVNLFDSMGVKFNYQTEWTWIESIKMYDNGNLLNSTNGKNIFEWMQQDMNVELDPHSHENDYAYADIAYMMTQVGVTPSKNIGGFIYDLSSDQDWQKHQSGTYATLDTSYFWKPDNLWGASTYLHQNNGDDQTYGAWKPLDSLHFYDHDSSQHLMYIGQGCKSSIAQMVSINDIFNIIDALNNGSVPDSGFYHASILMNNHYFDEPAYVKMVLQAINQIKAYDVNNRVVWSHLSEVGNEWRTSYNSKPFQLACDSIFGLTTDIKSDLTNNITTEINKIKAYPNPASDRISIEFERDINSISDIKIFNTIGLNVINFRAEQLNKNILSINTNGFIPGSYFIQFIYKNGETEKIVFNKL
jgi:hypothetical protein